MQTANLVLSLAGDHGNTVPLFGVTAAEIPVLQAIHTPDCIRDLEPAGEAVDEGTKRTNRAERQRLKAIYGRKENCPVEALYPGAAARVFEELDELDIPDEFYKAEKRATAKSAPTKAAATAGRTRRPTAPAASQTDEDGVGEMTDQAAFA